MESLVLQSKLSAKSIEIWHPKVRITFLNLVDNINRYLDCSLLMSELRDDFLFGQK